MLTELFGGKATRSAVSAIITALTGNVPRIVEPGNPTDCFGYERPNAGYETATYGTRLMPFQCFIFVERPSPDQVQFGISDADIYAAIAAVIPVATIAWVQLSSPPVTSLNNLLDRDFVLDYSQLADTPSAGATLGGLVLGTATLGGSPSSGTVGNLVLGGHALS